MQKDFVLKLIQGWIVAVCETFDEAMLANEGWASWILLVSHRWEWDEHVSPDWDIISECVNNFDIPIFVRIRFWHYAECRIAEEAWASAILEALKTEEWLKDSIDNDKFDIPIIREISEINELKKLKNTNWLFYLLLWDFSSWNVAPLLEKIDKFNTKKYWKIFVWWWISSPADIGLLPKEKIAWYFIWTALFYFDTEKYFKEAFEILQEKSFID